MSTIIVVEDDIGLNKTIRHQLVSLADELFGFFNLRRAYHFLKEQTADLVIIDRQLGDGDGLELVEYLHESHFYTKTLILSRLKTPDDKIKGLSLGADDYLAKPFHPVELKLRVKKLLYKEKVAERHFLKAKNLKLNTQTGKLYLNEKLIAVFRKKEMEVMATLMQYANQVVTHTQIAQRAWPGEKFYPSQTTINVYIRRIRIKLGKHKYLVETIRKFGYRLNPI